MSKKIHSDIISKPIPALVNNNPVKNYSIAKNFDLSVMV